jgi:uncharacterized membrane protein YqjE
MEPNVENKINKNPRKFEPISDEVDTHESKFDHETIRISGESPRRMDDGTYVEKESWKVTAEHLYHDMSRLMMREAELIRVEMGEKIDQIKQALLPMVLGGVFLAVGGLTLVATTIIVLNYFMPLWLSAVLVTAVLLVAGGLLINSAKSKLEKEELTPRQSVETLKEIKTTFKERVNEFTKH